MTYIQDGRTLFGDRKKGFYSVIPGLESGLFVDVGAAAGGVTKSLLQASPSSKVIAFEPFPGNLPFFEKSVGGDPRVVLLQKAVSDKKGTSIFNTGRTVEGTEPGWESKVGYSSGGMLAREGEVARYEAIEVETTTLDDEIKEQVRFLKIDVQGGELPVLRGAKSLFANGKIDIVFTEFSGQEGLIEFLFENDFVIYDTEYMIVPRKDDQQVPDWDVIGTKALSSGRIAFNAWPKGPPRAAAEYAAFMRSQRPTLMAAQTDLVAIRTRFISKFFEAMQLTG